MRQRESNLVVSKIMIPPGNLAVVRYEIPDGIAEVNAVRNIKSEDGMTTLNYYPYAPDWATSEDDCVGLEEKRKHIPTTRIIDVDELPR